MKFKIFEYISGARAQEDIAQISRYNRIPGTQGYKDALDYLLGQLKKIPLKDIEVKNYPVNKNTKYWDFLVSEIWEPIDAELSIVSPKDESRVLVRYKDEPVKLFSNSFSTPNEGYQAPLVYISGGQHPNDYKNKNVKGKFVLLDNPDPKSVFMAICKFGARAIITSFTPSGSLELPDIAGRLTFPVKQMKDYKPFGFSLTRREFEYLKKLFFKQREEAKDVVLKAYVKTRFRPGSYQVLTGIIPGKQKKEFILVAHLCHPKPSANDNASGCALLIEIARAITILVKDKLIPQPTYTLRFLFLPEWVGTLPWIIENQRRVKDIIGGVSLDMVGEDQKKCSSILGLYESHPSIPSFINDVFEMELAWVANNSKLKYAGRNDPLLWERRRYEGATDNMPFAYPLVKIPFLALVEWPDNYYHSTQDTVDKTDPLVLSKTALAVISAFLTICQQDRAKLKTLAEKCYLMSLERINKAYRQILSEIETTADEIKKTGASKFSQKIGLLQKKLLHRLEVELNSIKSLSNILQDEKFINGYVANLKQTTSEYKNRIQELALDALSANGISQKIMSKYKIGNRLLIQPYQMNKLEKIADRFIPVRRNPGLISMFSLTRWLSRAQYERFLQFYRRTGLTWAPDEAMYWLDGKKSLFELYQILQFENINVNLNTLMKYFKLVGECKKLLILRRR